MSEDNKNPTPSSNLGGSEAEKIALLEEEIGRLEDELDEARQAPWPEWASTILKTVRSYSGYDGYDDATEGVDLASEVEEALAELQSENERLQAAIAATAKEGE